MRRNPFGSWGNLLWLVGWIGIAVVVGTSSCSASKRQDTIRATLVGLNSARDGYTRWDLQHQKAIVEKATSREEGETKLSTYRERQATVVSSFEIAYRTLALAATQTDDPSLSAALTVSAELLEALRTLMGGSR